MKNTPYILLSLLSLSLASHAQDLDNSGLTVGSKQINLTSTATIHRTGSINALAGTYTIGGVAPDYATFSAAAADLSSQGVSGPVVFIVAPGTYSEQVVLNDIPGASAINRIVFRSLNNDSASVTLGFGSSSAMTNNYTLRVNGADYVTFSELTFSRPGNGVYSTIVELDNSAENITFFHNRFLGATGVASANTDGSRSCIFSPATSSHNNLVLEGNYFKDNANGIWINGDPLLYATGTVVSNNKFENFYVGTFLLYQDAPVVSGNSIVRNNTTSAIDFYGVSIRYSTGALLISKNKVIAFTGSYGIRLRACNGNAATPGITLNNFVQEGDATTGQCISLEDDCTYQYLLYNSVNHTGTGALGRALYINGAATTGIELYNNIFCNAGGGFGMYVNTNATSGIAASDYNCMYSTGTVLAYWGSNANTLAALQGLSGKEIHSLSGNPGYTSVSDLHANALLVNNTGTPIIGVADDIDGDTRSLTAPDMGADEFTPTGIKNMAVAQTVRVFPNPAAEYVFVETGSDAASLFEISIINLEGKVVLQRNVRSGTATTAASIYVGNLKAGTYLIKATLGVNSYVGSFVKQDVK